MAKPLDLAGKRFGNLEVIERSKNNKRGNTQWLCKCDCGKTVVVDGYGLSHGRNTTCGCAINKKGVPSAKRSDYAGVRFGKLTVIRLSEKRGANGTLYWECKCDCGSVVTVSRSNLALGHTKSCGCLRGEKNKHQEATIKKPLKQKKNRYEDLTGKRFGKLVVLGFDCRYGRRLKWKCRCDCGNEVVAYGDSLRSGKKKSCGCLVAETARKTSANRITHNMSKTRLYKLHRSMINRCKPNYHEHNNYYDKGISVCQEWERFEPFKKWAYENGYDDGLSLDRIDNNIGYSPENCRWVDMKTQENNRSNNVFISRDGVTKTMKEWSEYFGIPYGTVRARRRNGWSEDRLFEPLRK